MKIIVSSSPKHNPTFNLHSGLKEFKRLKQELTWVGVWEGKVADAGFLKKKKKEKDLVCFYPQLDSLTLSDSEIQHTTDREQQEINDCHYDEQTWQILQKNFTKLFLTRRIIWDFATLFNFIYKKNITYQK